jgi:hypothetical protein
MSTSPETIRVGDRIVSTIARWLTGHISDDEVRAALDAVDPTLLSPDQAEAVLEFQNELDVGTGRPAFEMVGRETLQDVAFCG